MKHLSIKLIILSSALILSVSSVYAGGFQLFEDSASGLGVSHADATAGANDASTEYNNPAGMVRIKQNEVSAGGEVIALHIKFTGDLYTGIDDKTGNVQKWDERSGVANAHDIAVVPNLHVVMPLNDKWYYGMGVTVPYGLAVTYKDDSVASQYATKSSIATINLSQELAYAVSNKFSVGMGVDVQRYGGEFDVNLNNQVTIKNKLSDVALGWHVGTLFQFTPETRVGLAFHSPIIHHGIGIGTTNSDGTLFPKLLHDSGTVTGEMPLPGWISAGFYHQVNKKVAVMANYTYTMWSIIKNLTINNIPIANVDGIDVSTSINLPEDFRNTSTLTAGFTYQLTSKWRLKYGLGYDQSPTTDKTRELRLPDSDKYLLSAGVRYQATKNLSVDAGYQHAFAAPTSIGKVSPLADIANIVKLDVHMQGDLKTSADLFGLQATYKF